MTDRSQSFTFQYLCGKKIPSLENKEHQELLMKWGMQNRIKVQTFSFDQPFQPYDKDSFLQSFFMHPEVTKNLQVISNSGKTSILGTPPDEISVEAEKLQCSVLSMSFFDRLRDESIVRESGRICKCLDEFVDDIVISDEVRKMLLMEESDNYDMYSEKERQELLFKIFGHFCIGGQICQYEDDIDPYLKLTKELYKDLVSVQKSPETKDLHVISTAFSIIVKATVSSGNVGERWGVYIPLVDTTTQVTLTQLDSKNIQDKEGTIYYPDDQPHIQTFSYLIIDPLKRHVTVFYHKFGGGGGF